MWRNRIESEIHACTVELRYLQSGAVLSEAQVRDSVYGMLTQCENELVKYIWLYSDYMQVRDFKRLILLTKQESALMPTATSTGNITESAIAKITSRAYEAVISILGQCEISLNMIPALGMIYHGAGVLKLYFNEKKDIADDYIQKNP